MLLFREKMVRTVKLEWTARRGSRVCQESQESEESSECKEKLGILVCRGEMETEGCQDRPGMRENG